MEGSFEVILIGAGFAGAATAYHLTRAGIGPILILEREDSYGVHASGRNAALFRQAVEHAAVAQMIQETAGVFRRAPEDFAHGDLLQRKGSFLLGSATRLEKLGQVLNRFSVPHHIYAFPHVPPDTPSDLRELLHQTQYEFLLHTPSDGVVDIHGLLGNYLQAGISRSLQVQYREEVLEIKSEGDAWLVKSSKGSYRTQIVVNGAGAWAPSLTPQGEAPADTLRPFRRHLFISEPKQVDVRGWPYVWDLDAEYYFRPESGGLLLCPGDEELHPPQAPAVDPVQKAVLREKLARHCPPLTQLGLAQGWACLRTKRPDGDFQLGEAPQWPGYFWAAALGGHGMSASYGLGLRLSRQIIDFLRGQENSLKVSIS